MPDDAAALRRTYLLGLVPLLGVLLFAAGGLLGVLTFDHNNGLACSGFDPQVASGCARRSYAPAVLTAVTGLVLTLAGGMYASYYAARNLGLPALAALRRRRDG